MLVFLVFAAARTFSRRDAPAHPYKTFWPRSFAGWMDSLLLWPIGMLEARIAAWPDAVRIAALVCSTFAGPLYETASHARWGQTFGKWVFGVCVLDVSEQTIRPWQAVKCSAVPLVLGAAWLARDVLSGARTITRENVTGPLAAISGIWFLLEVFTMLWSRSPKRRALHDFVAGTVVVRVIPLSRRTETAIQVT